MFCTTKRQCEMRKKGLAATPCNQQRYCSCVWDWEQEYCWPYARSKRTALADEPFPGELVPDSFASKVRIDATGPCKRAIENFTRYDLRWTNGWLESVFDRWDRLAREEGHLVFAGERAEAQNSFGNWIRVNYEC